MAARATAARVGLSLALLLYAALVVGSGFDRLSANAPAMERLVPRPFRAQAARSAAELASVRGQRGAMLANARQAVAADPVDPGSASLLGAALLLQGDNRGAERAFRVAARFGWRDVATQVYWFEAAVESNEMEPAADRLDALLRAQPDFPQSEALLARLETTGAGRAALERRLAARPGWLSTYVQISGLAPAAVPRRAGVLVELGRGGTRLGCAGVAPFVTGALDAGARREAEQVWLAHCPGARIDRGIADPGFEAFGTEQASPFGWQAAPSGDVSIEPVAVARGNRALRLRNGAPVTRLMLVQPVALPPGRYRLTAKVVPGRLAASIGCKGSPAMPQDVRGDPGQGGEMLELPDCERPALGLWLRPGANETELDDVALVPLAQSPASARE